MGVFWSVILSCLLRKVLIERNESKAQQNFIRCLCFQIRVTSVCHWELHLGQVSHLSRRKGKSWVLKIGANRQPKMSWPFKGRELSSALRDPANELTLPFSHTDFITSDGNSVISSKRALLMRNMTIRVVWLDCENVMFEMLQRDTLGVFVLSVWAQCHQLHTFQLWDGSNRICLPPPWEVS